LQAIKDDLMLLRDQVFRMEKIHHPLIFTMPEVHNRLGAFYEVLVAPNNPLISSVQNQVGQLLARSELFNLAPGIVRHCTQRINSILARGGADYSDSDSCQGHGSQREAGATTLKALQIGG
jgi:hypothetical protein